MIIYNAEVYTEQFRFEKKNICIRNGVFERISDGMIDPKPGEEVIDAVGLKVIPGLTDIHFHGCMGFDLCDGTDEALAEIARYERSVGVLNICPAVMTLPLDRLKSICKTAAAHRSAKDEAEMIGINLEGPFISKERAGAQDVRHIRKADISKIKELMEAGNGLAKLVTVAPENEGAVECIRNLKNEIHFSLGHTAAGYEEAAACFDAGADHVTHLFNAMNPFTHREPGLPGAAAERDYVMAELICDGVHVHKAAVRAAFKLFSADRIVLISDSMRACGMPDGEYELGGIPVTKSGREARQHDGTLAGSVVNLYDCMKEAVHMGIKAEDAIRAAAYNPAVSIGLGDKYGLIAEGRAAKLLIVDNDWEIKRIIA